MNHLNATFEQLHAAGCIQTGADPNRIRDVNADREKFLSLFYGLMQVTRSDPCRTGCPALKGCKAYSLYFTRNEETVEEVEAQRRKANYGGIAPVKVQPEEKGKEAKPLRLRCPTCGQKIRGENHAQHCTYRPKN